MTNKKIAVYGAYGHTGRFIVAEFIKHGLSPILCGRNAVKLNKLHKEFPALDARVADVQDPESLDKAFSSADIIVNCAGPFLDTAEPIIESAIRHSAHYIDLSAEQMSVLNVIKNYSEKAEKADIIVLPATAFFGGLADLLCSALLQDWKSADEILIGIGLNFWHPTKGTRSTGKRNHYSRLVLSDHTLVTLPENPKEIIWDFPKTIGTQTVVPVPLSEIITISHHIDVKSINTYLSRNSVDDIRTEDTPPPEAADDLGRSSQFFCMDIIATKNDQTRRITAEGRDIYAITAPLVFEAVSRLISGSIKRSGVTTLGEAFEAQDFLNSLSEGDLRVTYPI
jgi:hypothetical protein